MYAQHVHNQRSSSRTLEEMKHSYFPQIPINTNLSSSTRSTTRASPTNANSESIPAQTPRLVTQPEHGCQCPLSQTHCKKPQKPPSSYVEGIGYFKRESHVSRHSIFTKNPIPLNQQCSINSAVTAHFLATPHVQLQAFRQTLSVTWICCFPCSVSPQPRDASLSIHPLHPTDNKPQSRTLPTLEQRPSNTWSNMHVVCCSKGMISSFTSRAVD